MTIRKESKQYIRQQRKVDADLVKRPNEILKRSTDDGNLKLTFKSPTYYEKDIVVTKNAMLSSTPLIKTYASLESFESFILDLEGQEIITYNLTQNTTITDVINYNNGMSYKLYLKQDEVGGKSFVFDETISNITLFDNFQIDQTPNSITQIKIDVVEDTLYVQSYVKYKKVEYSEFGSIAFTIDTTLGSNAGPTFQLPLKEQKNVYIYNQFGELDDIIFGDYLNYDFIVDWGDGNSDNITSFDDVAKNHTYSTDGTYQITITGLCEGFGTVTNEWDWEYTTDDYEKIITVDELGYTGLIECDFMFNECSNLTSVTIESNDEWYKNITNMWYMFAYCDSLTNLDVSNWNVSNVTDMSYMFCECSLTTLDLSNWNVSNVTNMSYMFKACTSLTTLNVSNWNVSNVNYMEGVFRGCSSLTTLDVSNWDVSNVTIMTSMFNSCSSLTTLDVSNWDVSNVNYMNWMFYNTPLTTLDFSNWDVSNVTDMTSMFNRCTSLTTLDVNNWDVSNVTIMSYMFESCSSLTTLDVSNWDVSNVTNMDWMFYQCSSLTTLDVSNWNVSNVTIMGYMFYNTPLDTTSYDGLLIGWSGLPSLKSNIQFRANLAKYSSGAAATARGKLTSAPNNWTIIDGGQVV